MSLSNPEKVVTEERLSEFYKGIYPYLNGQLLANKFDKSSLYSTEEKIIGQWIDGKPLYQKTIVDTVPPLEDNGKYIPIGASIDFVMCDVYIITSQGVIHHLPQISTGDESTIQSLIRTFVRNNVSSDNANTVYIRSINQTAVIGQPVYIVIKYTKSTDGQISIGSDTDYSTTEKVVGTWIDGKPLYQKTFTDITIPTTTDAETVNLDIDITDLNLGNVVSIDGVIFNPMQIQHTLKFPAILDTSREICTAMIATANSGANKYLRIINTSSTISGRRAYVTIQYTKTTD